MRIKNTQELVNRSRWHARHDHVKQGTYGKSKTNGVTEFQGCAIGCLATPHRKRDLKAFVKALRAKFGDKNDGSITGLGYIDEGYVYEDDLAQLKRLKSEFGIIPELARVAESIFEHLPTHSEAIEFIPAFAAALNEGANFTPAKVEKAWERLSDNTNNHVSVDWASSPADWNEDERDEDHNQRIRDVRDKFLAWVGEQV
jgi:hypothetical protein